MADATPRLSSATDATGVLYAPLSWMAVCGMVTGVVFVVALLVLGFASYYLGKPLLSPVLLALPVLGVLLAFAARRSIHTSEGARTGLGYANCGWWLCVIGGLCYFAYWFATDWSIRTDAERQMKTWADKLISADPNSTDDPALREAFRLIIPIDRQNSPQVTDSKIFQAQFAGQLNTFRHTNLLLIASRNRDSVRIEPLGLRDWKQGDEGMMCEVGGLMTCAEGDFPLTVRLRSVVTERSRQWQVAGDPVYIPQDQFQRPLGARTRYGWMMERLQFVAHEMSAEFALTLMNQQTRQQQLYSPYPFPPISLGQSLVVETYMNRSLARDMPEKVLLSTLGRFQVAGAIAVVRPTKTDLGDDFFAREDGKPMTAEDRKILATVWDPPVYDPGRFMPAGWRNTTDPIRNSVIIVEPNRILVKVPVELKPYGGEFLTSPSAYTVGKLVFVCDDPTAVKEFNDARSAPRAVSPEYPEDLRNKPIPLRVIRIESNLLKMIPPAPKPQGG